MHYEPLVLSLLLVDLFESYDDARACERQKELMNSKGSKIQIYVIFKSDLIYLVHFSYSKII